MVRRGVCMRGGRVLIAGDVWGKDRRTGGVFSASLGSASPGQDRSLFLGQGCGIKGLVPTSVIQGNLPRFVGI